jgi:hypothetical protein
LLVLFSMNDDGLDGIVVVLLVIASLKHRIDKLRDIFIFGLL